MKGSTKSKSRLPFRRALWAQIFVALLLGEMHANLVTRFRNELARRGHLGAVDEHLIDHPAMLAAQGLNHVAYRCRGVRNHFPPLPMKSNYWSRFPSHISSSSELFPLKILRFE